MSPNNGNVPSFSSSDPPPLGIPTTQPTTDPFPNLQSTFQAPQHRPLVRISPYLFTKLNERFAFALTSSLPISDSPFAQKLRQARCEISGEIYKRFDTAMRASITDGGDHHTQNAVKRRRGYRKSKLSSVELSSLHLEEDCSEATMMSQTGYVESSLRREASGIAGPLLVKRKRNDSLLPAVFDNVKRRRSREVSQENSRENMQQSSQKESQGIRRQIEVLTGDGWADEVNEDDEFDPEEEEDEQSTLERKEDVDSKINVEDIIEDDELEA